MIRIDKKISEWSSQEWLKISEMDNDLEGQVARLKFNQVKKSDVYIFYNSSEETYLVTGSKNLRDVDFDEEQDIYILDLKNRWTYIHTHELDCGPYFYELA